MESENIVINLTQKQADYHSALFDKSGLIRTDNLYTEFDYFGGIGSGKSRIEMTCIDQINRMYPGAHGIMIRETYPELRDSVVPQYNTYFKQSGYRYLQSDSSCIYTNGSRLDFRAFDKDTKILSNEYDYIAFCQMEEIKEDLFLQALGRNRRKAGGLPKNIILGEGNPAAGWVKRRLKDKPLPPEILLIEARTRDNPFLPPEYEINLRKNYPAFWIARYLDGEWTNLDEAVFSEFREIEHTILPVDGQTIGTLKKRAGLDYGWVNPTAIVWGFVDYDGNLTIFDEWGGTQKIPDEIAEAARQYGQLPIIADYSIKKADRDGRSLWDDLTRAGLWLQESNKQELENITLANTLFKTGRLKITKNCSNLIREIQNYKWKKLKLGEDKNRPEEPVQKDNHYIDAKR
jgi:PBSX family phage terminase large subunit